MKKNFLISLVVILFLFIVVGCDKKMDTSSGDGITIDTSIEIGKKQYIEQLEKVSINGTNDYFIITEKVKWGESKQEKGTTVSSALAVPYTLHVNGKDYSSVYYLGDYSGKSKDYNPKYVLTITNITKDYKTEILIDKK